MIDDMRRGVHEDVHRDYVDGVRAESIVVLLIVAAVASRLIGLLG